MSAGTTRDPVQRAWHRVLVAIQPEDNVSAVIYGQVITGATLASAVGETRSLAELAVVTVTTILVFAVADAYAEAIGSRLAAARRRPAGPEQSSVPFRPRRELRRVLVMTAACLPPLAVVAVAEALGASPDAACYLGLGMITLSLIGYGLRSARLAGLRALPQVGVGFLLGGLGAAIIVLKAEVLH
jgi:hypothetical protein